MFSTAHKISTLRSATAQAVLRASPELISALREKRCPKGDALEVARSAGLIAAKRTWELIPHCHPLPLDQVTIDFSLQEDRLVIEATAIATWKTGVEMEALVAAQIAAATVFDMLKPIGNDMCITDVKVVEKRGGKSDFREELPAPFRAAVIVASDGTFAGKRKDRSGQIIRERLEAFTGTPCEYVILPDEAERIQQTVRDFQSRNFHLVISTGGTGLGPRDVTVEALEPLIDVPVPGIMEAARAHGQQRTPYAMLSRGIAGLAGSTLVIALPGSSQGVIESLDAIFPAVLHSYRMMNGGAH